MRTRIQKWGNSLAVRIPKPYADEARLSEDSPVDLTVREGELVIVPAGDEVLSLDDLVDRITPENRHAEVDMGGPVGDEIW